MIRVLLVDDQALIRQAISVMLDATDDITIVGQGDTGLDAITMAQRLQPDVVLMDIRMPELDGIAATEKICGDPDLAATRVLISEGLGQEPGIEDEGERVDDGEDEERVALDQ